MSVAVYGVERESAAEISVRQLLNGFGFFIATVGFPGDDGGRWVYAHRTVDGVDADFSVNLSTGEVRRWGTLDTWKRDDLAAAFGAAAAVATVSDPAPAADQEPQPVTVTAGDTSGPSPAWIAAGFSGFRESAAVPGFLRKFWALQPDGSRWLIDPNTDSFVCVSESPVTIYRLVSIGTGWRLQRVDDGSLRPLAVKRNPASTPANLSSVPTVRRTAGLLFE